MLSYIALINGFSQPLSNVQKVRYVRDPYPYFLTCVAGFDKPQ